MPAVDEAAFQTKLPCPKCHQRIALPTADLSRSFRCPRCRTIHFAGDIINRDVTLQAVPAIGAIIDAVLVEDAPDAHPTLPHPPIARTPIQLAAISDAIPDTTRDVRSSPIATPATAMQAPPTAASEPARIYPPPPPPPAIAKPTPVPAPLPLVPNAVAANIGAEKPSRLGAVTRLAVLIDAKLGPYRGWIWIAVLAVFIVSGPVGGFFGWPILDPISWTLLSVWLVLALLTKLDLFIDETGATNLRLGIGLLWSRGAARLEMGDDPTPTDRLRAARTAALVAALVVFAVEKTLVAITEAREPTFLIYVGGFLLAAGLLAHLRLRRRSASTTGAPVDIESPAESRRIAGELPEVLALNDRGSVERALAGIGGGLVREFIAAVAQWAPRRCTQESDYKFRLLARILRLGVAAKTEFGVARDGRVGRIDLVIAEQLGVELKYNIRPADMRTALAQVDDYMKMWPDKPMFLLLCGREIQSAHVKTFFTPEVVKRRAEGRALTVLLLGT